VSTPSPLSSFSATLFSTRMTYTLQIIQIVSSILLIVLVLMQRSQTDSGGMVGGDGGSFLQTRRGAERFLFIFTVIIAIIFAGSSLASIILGA
jgi:protein translocase SecG subunit